MPRFKRKEQEAVSGPMNSITPVRVMGPKLTLVKRAETAADAGPVTDWPTLNLSGGAMSGAEWDGQPFAASGMSSGHSQSSGTGARRTDFGGPPAASLDGSDWPAFASLGSPAGRTRALSGAALSLMSTGGPCTSDEEAAGGPGDEEDVEWVPYGGGSGTDPGSVPRPHSASASFPRASEPEAGEASNGDRFRAQLPPSMGRPVKLVDARGQFALPDALSSCLRPDGVNYLVVGVLGACGVGKSSILNWLANGHLPGVASKPLEAELEPETALEVENGQLEEEEEHNNNNNNNNNNNPARPGELFSKGAEDWERLRGNLQGALFPTQTVASLIAGQAQTFGIDVMVTATERLVMLDSQPVNSTCICPDLLPSKTSASGSTSTDDNTAVAHGAGTESASLRLASFLLSVCHAVLVVLEDCPADLELLHLVHTAAMLKPSILVGGQPGQAARRTKSEAGEKEEEAEEEEDDEESEEEEGEAAGERKTRRKRLATTAAQTDYMARVFWVVNKVENCAHWNAGRPGQDWRRLLDDLFRLRPPTEVTVPALVSRQPGAEPSEEASEGAEETREGSRSRHASEASNKGREAGRSPGPSKKDGKRKKTSRGRTTSVSAPPEAEAVKESPERRLRLFCLPLLLPSEERSAHQGPLESYKWLEEEFEENARLLLRELLALPRHHMQSPQAAFTERKWLKFAQELWDTVNSSPLFADYNGLIV